MSSKFSVAASLREKQSVGPNPVFQFLRRLAGRFDYMQIVPMLTLLAIGALFIYGTGQQVGGVHAEVFWKRQLFYMGLGFTAWLILSFTDYRWFGPASFVLYPLSLLLLGYVLLNGVERFGARRWLDIAGVSIQPSEIAKLGILLGASWLLSMKKADINKLPWAAGLCLLTALPFLLILKEPDLGTALVLIPVVGTIAFTGGLKWRYLLILLIAGAAFMPTAYYMMKPYQKERIRVFLDPDRDPQNRGWNQLQAEMAVGSGGLTGKGFMQGTHCTLGYLPQTVANSDFIFPVIAEETGLLGTLALVFIYAALLFSILRTAILAPDAFGRYLCVGVAVLLLTHTAVNIGMCIRIAPVTGLPLPLVSYGGTFMIATMVYLGIVQSVYIHRDKETFMAL